MVRALSKLQMEEAREPNAERTLDCFRGEAFSPPKANNKRHVGEKHKTKGLVMPQNTWQAIELGSLLDGAAQYTTKSPCWWGPLGPALLPSCWGVAAALLHHLVVCRGAGKSPPFFYFPLQPTQWLSVRGLGKAEPKGRGSVLWFQAGSLSLDGDIRLLLLHRLHTGGGPCRRVCGRGLLADGMSTVPPEQDPGGGGQWSQ